MSCTLATAVQGDVDDVRHVALSGGELDNDDLVGATVEGHVWPVAGGASTNLPGSVVNAARKIIAVSLGGAGGWLPSLSITEDTEFFIEYEITFLSGAILTWPSPEPDRILVRVQGA